MERPLARRIERERLFEDLRPELDVLVPRHPSRPERQRERGALRAVRRLVEELALDREEPVDVTALDEHPFEERRSLFGGRIGAVGLLEQPFHRVGREATRNPRRAQVQARTERRVDRVPCLPLQLRDVRLPRAALRLNILEASAGLLVRPAARRHRLRVRARRLVVVPLVLQHVPQLEEKAARAEVVLHGLQLELAELLDHVELAEVPVDRASVLQGLDERRVQLVGVLEVLQRLHAGEELRLEHATQPKVVLRLRRVARVAPRDPFLEFFDQALPVADGLEVRKTLLKVHGLPRLWINRSATGPPNGVRVRTPRWDPFVVRLLGEQRYQSERASESPS